MRIAILAALAIFPAAASAQFTTVITPPEKKPAPTVAQASVTDSAQNAKMTDMRVWVDSAAATVSVNDSAVTVTADSAQVTVTAEPEVRRTESPGRLPDTATPLPLLALIGAGLAGLGAWLARGRRTAS